MYKSLFVGRSIHLELCDTAFRKMEDGTYVVAKERSGILGDPVNKEEVENRINSDEKVCIISGGKEEVLHVLNKYEYNFDVEPFENRNVFKEDQ